MIEIEQNSVDDVGAALRLADEITEDLFTNGQNENADSLRLFKDGRDLGGWSKFGVRSRIQTLILNSEFGKRK